MRQKLSFFLAALIILNLLFVTVGESAPSAEAIQPKASQLRFKWAIIHNDGKGREKIIYPGRDSSVTSGDRLKIFIQPIENVYVYFYLLDSSQDLALIFPASPSDFSNNYAMGREYYLPAGRQWFTVDELKGKETFYLIASRERLTQLEAFTKEYIEAVHEGRTAAKAKVLTEIKRVRKSFSRFTTLGEKPVPIAGAVRGMNPSLAKSVHYVEADNFYSKTIRLEHK